MHARIPFPAPRPPNGATLSRTSPRRPGGFAGRPSADAYHAQMPAQEATLPRVLAVPCRLGGRPGSEAPDKREEARGEDGPATPPRRGMKALARRQSSRGCFAQIRLHQCLSHLAGEVPIGAGGHTHPEARRRESPTRPLRAASSAAGTRRRRARASRRVFGDCWMLSALLRSLGTPCPASSRARVGRALGAALAEHGPEVSRRRGSRPGTRVPTEDAGS